MAARGRASRQSKRQWRWRAEAERCEVRRRLNSTRRASERACGHSLCLQQPSPVPCLSLCVSAVSAVCSVCCGCCLRCLNSTREVRRLLPLRLVAPQRRPTARSLRLPGRLLAGATRCCSNCALSFALGGRSSWSRARQASNGWQRRRGDCSSPKRRSRGSRRRRRLKCRQPRSSWLCTRTHERVSWLSSKRRARSGSERNRQWHSAVRGCSRQRTRGRPAESKAKHCSSGQRCNTHKRDAARHTNTTLQPPSADFHPTRLSPTHLSACWRLCRGLAALFLSAPLARSLRGAFGRASRPGTQPIHRARTRTTRRRGGRRWKQAESGHKEAESASSRHDVVVNSTELVGGARGTCSATEQSAERPVTSP